MLVLVLVLRAGAGACASASTFRFPPSVPYLHTLTDIAPYRCRGRVHVKYFNFITLPSKKLRLAPGQFTSVFMFVLCMAIACFAFCHLRLPSDASTPDSHVEMSRVVRPRHPDCHVPQATSTRQLDSPRSCEVPFQHWGYSARYSYSLQRTSSRAGSSPWASTK